MSNAELCRRYSNSEEDTESILSKGREKRECVLLSKGMREKESVCFEQRHEEKRSVCFKEKA